MKSKRITKESLMKGIKKITKHKLFKNKLYSSILMLIGFFSIKLLEGDITVFIFMLMIGLPVFFSKENVIVYTQKGSSFKLSFNGLEMKSAEELKNKLNETV